MFSLRDVEQENFSGEIGTLIRAIQKIPTHTQSKVKLISELRTLNSESRTSNVVLAPN